MPAAAQSFEADFVETPYPGGRSSWLRDTDSVWTPDEKYDLMFRVMLDETVSGERVSFGTLKPGWRQVRCGVRSRLHRDRELPHERFDVAIHPHPQLITEGLDRSEIHAPDR